ncbi:MAG: hypothetical protein V7717_02140 [Porticoccaceae bacterium]
MDENEFKIEVVWQQMTPELSAEVIEFWLKEKALPDMKLAEERVKQVLVVCREIQTNDIVGLTTVLKMRAPRLLNNVVYYYRLFVAEAWRKKNIGTEMLGVSREHLNQRFVSGEDISAKGLFSVTESPILKKSRRQGVSPAGVFMGVNETGDHLRIAWFDGAHIID